MKDTNFTLVCFAGAGGTGKTSVVDAMAKRLTYNSTKVEVHRSIVRAFYGLRGIKDEAAFLKMSPVERRDFQLALYTHYIDSLEHCCSNALSLGVQVVLCERSIFDHAAYTVYGSRELFDAEGQKVLEAGVRRFKALKPAVFYLPYPTPWDHFAADGFRARELAKDTIVDALIHKQLSANRSVWVHTLPTVNIEARVNGVFHILWGNSELVGTANQRNT